jgi:hypothetical protein
MLKIHLENFPDNSFLSNNHLTAELSVRTVKGRPYT